MLGLRNDQHYRLVSTDGKELIAPREKSYYGGVFNGFYVFSNDCHPAHLGVDEAPLFAYEPTKGKCVFGADIEKLVFKQKVPFKKIDQDFVHASVVKVNRLEEKSANVHLRLPQDHSSYYKPLTYEPSAPDGWDNDHAVVYCWRTGSSDVDYGIINRQYEFVIKPKFASLEYLFDDVYLAKLTKNGDCEAIKTDGTPVDLLPPNTVDAAYSNGMIICQQQSGIESKTSKTSSSKIHRWVTLIDCKGRVLQSVQDCRVIGFKHGIAILATSNWKFLWLEESLAILTKDGVNQSGICGSWAVPISEDELILGRLDTDFGKLYSFKPGFFSNCSVPNEMQFLYKLRRHDLIGMSKDQMDDLFCIPVESGRRLTLVSDMREQNANQIEFRYLDRKVEAWRWVNRRKGKDSFGPWISKNVLVDWSPFGKYRNDKEELVDWNTVRIEDKISAVGASEI